MTALVRALSALLTALPRTPLVQAAFHIGPSHVTNHVTPADEHHCGHDDDYDLDAPQPVLVLLPIAAAAGLFEEAGNRCRNGDDPAEVGWELARTLELGEID